MPLPPSFPDLTSLDLFASVVRLGSVSRAADAHGIAQPSASARIRRLERQLGLTLLDRSPSGSTPSVAGALVADWVTALLAAADDLSLAVAALTGPSDAHLRIAASNTVAENLLPAWLSALRQVDGERTFELEVLNSTVVLGRVRGAAVDLGFVESPAPASDLAARVVSQDRLIVVVEPGHPWAARTSIGATDLAGAALVVREVGSGTREALAAALHRHGLDMAAPAVELGSNTAVRTAVMAGAGPAVVSDLAVDADIAAGRLIGIDVDDLDLHRDLRAVWRRDAPLTATAAALIDLASRASP